MADPAGTGGAPNTPVSSQVVDALTIGNVKTVGEAASFAMAQLFQMQTQATGLAMQNLVAQQNLALQSQTASANRLAILAEAGIGKFLETATSVDPQEAISTGKLFQTGANSDILSLLTQLSGGQVGAKVAQSTPGELAGDIAKLTASVASQGQQIAALIALSQQLMKGAQSTPPETATGKVA